MSETETEENTDDASGEVDEPTGAEPGEEEFEEVIPEEAVEDVEDGGGLIDFLNEGGIKGMLLEETFQDPDTGHTYGQAHLVADVINVMRMDTKQMAALHGIDIEVEKMSPERAAELLEDVAKNDGMGIIEVFQEIEDQQDIILKQKMTEEQHDKYMNFKEEMLYSVPSEGER